MTMPTLEVSQSVQIHSLRTKISKRSGSRAQRENIESAD